MAKKMVRRRITGPPTSEEATRWRKARDEELADRERTKAASRELVERTAGLAEVVTSIRALRQQLGMQASDVAARMGIDKSNYTRLESGTGNPTLATVAKMAEAAGFEVVVTVRAR